MITLAKCPCGGIALIFTETSGYNEPNTPWNAPWNARCECRQCSFSLTLLREFETREDAVNAAADKWNTHPVVAKSVEQEEKITALVQQNAALQSEKDDKETQLQKLAGRVFDLNDYCQRKNIGEWGDSVVSAVMRHCDAMEAKLHRITGVWQHCAGRVHSLEEISMMGDAITANPRQCLQYAEADAVARFSAELCKNLDDKMPATCITVFAEDYVRQLKLGAGKP